MTTDNVTRSDIAVSRLLKQEIELHVIPTAGITCYSVSCFIAFPIAISEIKPQTSKKQQTSQP